MSDDVAGSFVVLKRLPNRLRCIISNSGTDKSRPLIVDFKSGIHARIDSDVDVSRDYLTPA